MKATESFKEVIEAQLQLMGKNDKLFAKSLQKEGKNINDCITYILNTVKNSGCNGFTDNEIFGMAAHYYDEDTIAIGQPVNCKVIVNHSIDAPKPTPQPTKPVIQKEDKNQLTLF